MAPATEATDVEEVVTLPAGVTVEDLDDGRLRLCWRARNFAIGPLLPEVSEAVKSLRSAPRVSAGRAARQAEPAARQAEPAARQLEHVLGRLSARGWLERTVRQDGRDLATLVPRFGAGAGWAAEAAGDGRPEHHPGAARQLSRFASLLRCGSELVLESPLVGAALRLHDAGVAALIAALASAVPTSGLLDGAAARAVVDLLDSAGFLTDPDADPESEDRRLAQWSATDLAFHAASRYGRHQGGYGGTLPLEGRFEPLPERKDLLGAPVQLDRPGPPDAAGAALAGLTGVLERRRSIRRHDDAAAISAAQLAAFLYHSAGRRPDGHRAYPGGGGLYELELYPAVSRCSGLASGLYHYDPVEHRLGRVAEDGPAVRALVNDAGGRALMAAAPQVLIVIAARFGRVMYRYESIAYATILKNVGALFQTMYCVATAMGLAPCAIGGGSADAFCIASGLDYCEESSVGEFVLGSAGERQ
ncbi:MAG TPA: SagB family peptide dehydrogenase [Acidimicrobiales bacterium]|jgi:SagB-type dehydrogenase family enzyme|nr:SagB family peptide dehydrogenase [Acidimicrobiales bacterium]